MGGVRVMCNVEMCLNAFTLHQDQLVLMQSQNGRVSIHITTTSADLSSLHIQEHRVNPFRHEADSKEIHIKNI